MTEKCQASFQNNDDDLPMLDEASSRTGEAPVLVSSPSVRFLILFSCFSGNGIEVVERKDRVCPKAPKPVGRLASFPAPPGFKPNLILCRRLLLCRARIQVCLELGILNN